jgi:hypothetical protein
LKRIGENKTTVNQEKAESIKKLHRAVELVLGGLRTV